MADRKPRVQFFISGRKVAFILFAVCFLLFTLNLTGIYFKLYLRADLFVSNAIYFFFDASRESSFQTIFSTLLLLLAAVVVAIIGRITEPPQPARKYWFVLSAMFCGLAIDESLAVHEQLNKLRPFVNDESGLLYYTWIIPYALLALLTGLFFLRFLYLLSADIRRLFLISGFMYVGAAIGMEVIEGYFAYREGVGNLRDKLLCAVEEFLEMSSISLFIYAALRYARVFQKDLGVRFG